MFASNVPASPSTATRSYLTATHVPRRIVLPTTRVARIYTQAAAHKHKQNLLTKASRHPTPEPLPQPQATPAPWVTNLGRFDVVHAQTEMDGFKLYAVDTWVIQRTLLPPCVLVWTGRSEDKVTVTVLAPRSDLTEREAAAEIDHVTQLYRKDCASRPRETREGIIFEADLSAFRHDLTTLLIPGGNFVDLRDQLYTNINLLRMGCAGRMSLSLEQPTESTQGRFRQLYCIPDSKREIQDVVIDLVCMVQSGLAVFGSYSRERDGLLCDHTRDAVRSWASDVGSKVLSIEISERHLDPSIVAALVSLTVSMRNKLHALNASQAAARDPFDEPTSLLQAQALFFDPAFGRGTGNGTQPTKPPPAITLTTIHAISSAFERTNRTRGETFRVHRVLPSIPGMGRDATTFLPCEPTGDIARFAGAIASAASALKERDRDVYPASVRILWTGRVDRDAGPGGTRRGRKRHHDDTAAVKADEWDAASMMRLQSDEEAGSGGVLRGMKSFDMFSRNRSRKGLDQINMGPSSSSHKLDTQLLPALIISGEEDFSGGEMSPIRHGATNLNLSDDDMSGDALPAMRDTRKLHRRTNEQVRTWHSGGHSSASEQRPVFQRHGKTMPHVPERTSVLETRFDYDEASSHSSLGLGMGAKDDEEAARLAHRQRRFAARHKRCRSFGDRDLIMAKQMEPLKLLQMDVAIAWEKRQCDAQEQHIRRLASVLRDVVFTLESTNQQLSLEYEHAKRLINSLEVSLGSLEENAKLEGDRANTHARKTTEIAYRVDSAAARLQTDMRTVLDKRRELWTTRAAAMTSHVRPDGYAMLRGIGAPKTMIDMEGRTEEEAEEEAQLAGHETPLFPPGELEGSRRAALWSWLGGLPGSLWRASGGEVALAGSPTAPVPVEEADEAGFSPLVPQQLSTWEWLTRQNRRRQQEPSEESGTQQQQPKTRRQDASRSPERIKAARHGAERDLMTFSDEEGDSERYVSAEG